MSKFAELRYVKRLNGKHRLIDGGGLMEDPE
jgi:hypothetical protein